MGALFGTDGVRGVANAELTPELALSLGRAVVATLREEGVARPEVVVGRDPRASGEMLEAALVAGMTSAGGDVTVVGVLPTPAVAYLTLDLGAAAGAMISASHNPVADNGIKFFGPDGYKLTDDEEARVEQLVDVPGLPRPTGAGVGRVRRRPQLLERYVDHLVATTQADLSRYRVVVDCANGAAAGLAPQVLRRLGCDVVAVHDQPDGLNINAGCGSTHPEVVAAAVTTHHADVGLAHDGDADRLIAADADGNVVDGDAILALLAAHRHRTDGLPAVVTTVMTNLGFKQAMEALGIVVEQTRVGDRYVLEAMRAGGYPLGGEQSGHLIFLDHATTGDGVLSAVQLLATMAETGRSLSELATVMRRLPQVLVNVDRGDRSGLERCERLWQAVAEEEKALQAEGRVLVRASGTEPKIRVMVEAATHEQAVAVAERLAAVVRADLGAQAG